MYATDAVHVAEIARVVSGFAAAGAISKASDGCSGGVDAITTAGTRRKIIPASAMIRSDLFLVSACR